MKETDKGRHLVTTPDTQVNGLGGPAPAPAAKRRRRRRRSGADALDDLFGPVPSLYVTAARSFADSSVEV